MNKFISSYIFIIACLVIILLGDMCAVIEIEILSKYFYCPM